MDKLMEEKSEMWEECSLCFLNVLHPKFQKAESNKPILRIFHPHFPLITFSFLYHTKRFRIIEVIPCALKPHLSHFHL